MPGSAQDSIPTRYQALAWCALPSLGEPFANKKYLVTVLPGKVVTAVLSDGRRSILQAQSGAISRVPSRDVPCHTEPVKVKAGPASRSYPVPAVTQAHLA